MITAYLLVALAQQPGKPEALMTRLGGFHRAVSTKNRTCQQFFDQGLACLYGYQYSTALRSFQQAINADPECAMAYWGLAASYGPTINTPDVDAEDSKKALEALDHADKAKEASELERELIAAQRLRFNASGPKDRTALNAAFSNRMRTVWEHHRRDSDVGSLFAEALLDERPWDQWTLDGKPNPGTEEAVSTVEEVLRQSPRHPMALHVYIHAVEASPHPEKALKAADTLFDLQPDLSHMQHMPCHIYARTGQWAKSIHSNIVAIARVKEYQLSRGISPKAAPNVGHYSHALAFAAGMRGQSKIALHSMDLGGLSNEYLEKNAANFDGELAMPLEVQQQFGKWDDVLSAQIFGKGLPIARTMQAGARAVAFAATGELEQAKKELVRFAEAKQLIPADKADGRTMIHDVLAVEQHLATGEVLIREAGKEEEGLQEMRKAVELEDHLPYSEPPDWIMPTRHALGAALLMLGKYPEALDVFNENLRRLPNDGWATMGLSKALRGLGQVKEADKTLAKFKTLWKDADITISTSCMCLEPRTK
ncbi:MAG: hypothetical protein JSS72_10800 [Armatimonadetes bacterium]|nr:hypothetical protein [Armatimonadota bacterium]